MLLLLLEDEMICLNSLTFFLYPELTGSEGLPGREITCLYTQSSICPEIIVIAKKSKHGTKEEEARAPQVESTNRQLHGFPPTTTNINNYREDNRKQFL